MQKQLRRARERNGEFGRTFGFGLWWDPKPRESTQVPQQDVTTSMMQEIVWVRVSILWGLGLFDQDVDEVRGRENSKWQ